MKITEGYMPFLGHQTYYRIAGECRDGKAPLLLLHGGPGSTHNYFEVLDALADTGRAIISYDQIGCGNSYLDGHPELWTLDFLAALKRILNPFGILAAYSSAYPFLGALLRTGFFVSESVPFGRKRGGTVASLHALDHLSPLREKDRCIALESTAGTPYRDPSLDWSRGQILTEHARQIAELRAAGVPKWFHPGGKTISKS